MHIYIYDTFVSDKRYNTTVSRIETRLTDLGLNGKIIRLNLLTSLQETINNELKKGAKTITVVGNFIILSQAVDVMAKIAKANPGLAAVPLGFIPVGREHNRIASVLGIKSDEAACDVLSARRVERLDLGLANNRYFLTVARMPTLGTELEIDNNYTLEIKKEGWIEIVNLPLALKQSGSSPLDRKMELKILSEGSKLPLVKRETHGPESVFDFDLLKIIKSQHKIVLDENFALEPPVEIKVAETGINLIVSKERGF